MKKAAVLFVLAGLLFSCGQNDAPHLILTNPMDQPRTDVGVVIQRSLFDVFPDANEGMVPILNVSGNILPAQIDDLDGDGTWDELFVLLNIGANESLQATVSFTTPDDYPEFTSRTNIRFARKDRNYEEVISDTRVQNATNTETQKVWQMEGIAWENDMIGFRNYFDQRNGMDIYGKVTTSMVLDKVGHKDSPSYHKFNPEWGVDVLKVGNSLGAGSIAYSYGDSLYRVGDNGSATCTVLTEGPFRSIFRFTFDNWIMDDQSLDVVHDVSIQAGTHYYESKVSFEGMDKKPELVTGIVNQKSESLVEVEGLKKAKAFYTFDLQSEDTTLLGMAIMVPSDQFSKTTEAPNEGSGITETYCIHLDAAQGNVNMFRFYTVWERQNDQWKTAEGFERLLASEAELMREPVRVKVEGK